MNKIISMGVNATDKKKEHNVEVRVVFDEPVTQREAEDRVAEAISDYLFGLMKDSEV